jgi:hypothetical protein
MSQGVWEAKRLPLTQCYLSVVPGQAASAYLGKLLEIQILGPHSRLTESESDFGYLCFNKLV